MKKTILIALIAGAALPALTPAAARDGCGMYMHRNAWGHCRANGYRPGVYAVTPRIGVFYSGRGYWDGQRYRMNRSRWNGGWRYGDGDHHGDWNHHDDGHDHGGDNGNWHDHGDDNR